MTASGSPRPPRRVLLVAYNFPPIGGVGIQRTLKFATYLRRFGWQPVVLTASNPGYGERDYEIERNVSPDIAVERARSPEPIKLRHFLGRLTGPLRGRGGAGSSRAGSSGTGAAGDAVETPATVRRPGRLTRLLLGWWGAWTRFIFFPDEEVGWVPFAARRGVAVHRRSPVDAIYSSSPPVSSHYAAGLIARRTGLPWIADFRDPWIGNAHAAALPFWQRPFQRRLEKWIVANADRIVFASPGFQEQYEPRYPWAAGRMSTIPNGYDRNDFGPEILAAIARQAPVGLDRSTRKPAGPAAPATPPTRFKLLYAGSIYGDHELQVFLEGVELLLSRRPELRSVLDVEFIGWLNLHNQAIAAAFDRPDRLAGVVRYSGFVPHAEALRRMVGADALFNVIADEPRKEKIASGKLTEYVGLDKQILAFVPEGSARELLRELDWGIVADPTAEGIAGGIERALAAPPPNRRADPEGRYDRVNLTERLARVLDSIASEAERGGATERGGRKARP